MLFMWLKLKLSLCCIQSSIVRRTLTTGSPMIVAWCSPSPGRECFKINTMECFAVILHLKKS